MSTTKRSEATPGPWLLDSAGLIYDSRNRTIAHARYGNIILEDEQRANAHVLVSALAMRAALERLLQPNHTPETWDAATEEARAALASARGEVGR